MAIFPKCRLKLFVNFTTVFQLRIQCIRSLDIESNIMASLSEYERELIRERKPMQDYNLPGQEVEWEVCRGYTPETISKLLLLRNIYKDVPKLPEEIYKLFGLTRATFYM